MKQKILKVGGGVVAVSVLGMSTAIAAVPTEVTTAMGNAAADAAEIGGLALIAVIAAVAFKYARRAL